VGNKIPAQLLSPQAPVAQQQFFPLPNFGRADSTGGKITSTHIFPPAGSPRTGQLGLRWNF
jgi:hypothetical protein